MPVSPMSGKSQGEFSNAPVGKKALSADELKHALDDQMAQAAAVLGGTVIGAPGSIDEPDEEVTKYTMEIPEDVKRNYIRSLLAKLPFTHEFNLFGGTLRVQFRTRTAGEMEIIGKLPEDRRFDAKLVYSLAMLQLGDQSTHETIKDLNDIASAAVFAAFGEFEEICDEMFRRANDPDFWTGTAGRT